jgi:hypothetical protein
VPLPGVRWGVGEEVKRFAKTVKKTRTRLLACPGSIPCLAILGGCKRYPRAGICQPPLGWQHWARQRSRGLSGLRRHSFSLHVVAGGLGTEGAGCARFAGPGRLCRRMLAGWLLDAGKFNGYTGTPLKSDVGLCWILLVYSAHGGRWELWMEPQNRSQHTDVRWIVMP